MVNIEIMELIKRGKIKHNLMTHKDMMDYKGPISVYTPGKEDQAIAMEVTSVMHVGSGFLATGYPESWRTRGRSNGVNVLNVKPLTKKVTAKPEEAHVPTDAEGDE